MTGKTKPPSSDKSAKDQFEREQERRLAMAMKSIHGYLAIPNEQGVAFSRCTEEFTAEFCEYIRQGLPIVHTCSLLRMGRKTYYEWREKAERAEAAFENDPNDPLVKQLAPYVRFMISVRKAQANFILERTQKLLKADDAMWKRDMAILERIDRENWGKSVAITTDDSPPDEEFL